MKAAQAELEKAFAGTETEKALRLSLESKLSEMRKMHKGDLEMVLVLEEKDRSGSHLGEILTSHYLPCGERIVPFLPFFSSIPSLSQGCEWLTGTSPKQ